MKKIRQTLSDVCRYCSAPRPNNYSVTCGKPSCQEAMVVALHRAQKIAETAKRRNESR